MNKYLSKHEFLTMLNFALIMYVMVLTMMLDKLHFLIDFMCFLLGASLSALTMLTWNLTKDDE